MSKYETKYITIRERDNEEAPNAGTISGMVVGHDLDNLFQQAVESHFDAELLGISFPNPDVDNIRDCINACPIDVRVFMEGVDDEPGVYTMELSQTWLYQN